MLKLSHTCAECGVLTDFDLQQIIEEYWLPEYNKNRTSASGWIWTVKIYCSCGTQYTMDGPLYEYVFRTLFSEYLSFQV